MRRGGVSECGTVTSAGTGCTVVVRSARAAAYVVAGIRSAFRDVLPRVMVVAAHRPSPTTRTRRPIQTWTKATARPNRITVVPTQRPSTPHARCWTARFLGASECEARLIPLSRHDLEGGLAPFPQRVLHKSLPIGPRIGGLVRTLLCCPWLEGSSTLGPDATVTLAARSGPFPRTRSVPLGDPNGTAGSRGRRSDSGPRRGESCPAARAVQQIRRYSS